MFKTYLSSIKEQKEIEQLQDSINNMIVLIEKMDKIMDAVGKEVLKDSHEEYQQIVEETEKAEAKSVCLLLSRCIKITVDRSKIKKRQEQVVQFLTALDDMYTRQEAETKTLGTAPEDISLELASDLMHSFVDSLSKIGMSIRDVDFKIHEDISVIHPHLKDPDKFKDLYSMLCSGQYYYRIFHVIDSAKSTIVSNASPITTNTTTTP